MNRLLFNRVDVRAIVFWAVALLSLATGNAFGATLLGRSLVELETHIQWTAVDDNWEALRADWLSQTAACEDPACVAQHMAALEEHVKWEAVDPAWKQRRDGWVDECRKAKTGAEVGKLLLEFEKNVSWKAVDEKWKELRGDWVEAIDRS